ncbi:hypothetical protein [Campylobacter concisus]|uniref:hypothetical protein n=1 Tax=Campylobacter concisus TaxID=199 RepID=UPI00112FB8D6|nr:hypothetical protein [Campylobacter concisus]
MYKFRVLSNLKFALNFAVFTEKPALFFVKFDISKVQNSKFHIHILFAKFITDVAICFTKNTCINLALPKI